MRAPRVWRIEERFDRFYVVNQFGGFAGWRDTPEAALEQAREYVRLDGDKFLERDSFAGLSERYETYSIQDAAGEMFALLVTLQRKNKWHPNSPASQIVKRAEEALHQH